LGEAEGGGPQNPHKATVKPEVPSTDPSKE
jgi:hypothetical protein